MARCCRSQECKYEGMRILVRFEWGMDSSVTLWQFLLRLLLDPSYERLICWTSEDGEFKLLQAEEVAKLWGARKNKPSMNYDKLSRALRYYYEKNIIRKVNGQKFVYRFVSYPDILCGEPAVKMERAGEACSGGPKGPERGENSAGDGKTGAGATCEQSSGKPSGRYDYIHSGLYTTFTLTSLQAGAQLFKSKKVENPGEKIGEKPRRAHRDPKPSVIKFGAVPAERTSPSPPPPSVAAESESSELKHHAPLQASQSTEGQVPGHPLERIPAPVPTPSRSPTPSTVPDSSQDLVIDSDMESTSSQPSEVEPAAGQNVISSGRDAGSSAPPNSAGGPHNGRLKKPKGLQLTPTLVVTGSDQSPLNLSSPSHPTASLTPAILQTPTLLLTPSPLLSNIHFWSTLSPVAPLSPARRQGPHTLFQFPSGLNTQFQCPVISLDGSTTPRPLSPDPQKT
ncbi:hypothetical protein GJAV_G00170160 [Gymnothorax javanicus]|nr:hypothetical protein GJAV_G00170160 [Gymnothorax javanicus]